jgi:hypothetical protein
MKKNSLYLITASVLAVALITSVPAVASASPFNSILSKKSISQDIYQASNADNSNDSNDNSETSNNATNDNADISNNTTNDNSDSSFSGSNSFGSESGSSAESSTPLVLSTVKGDEQTIKTKHDPYSYPNIVVQKGVPAVWTINASSQSLQSCNSYIVFPSLNMQGQLRQGNNVVKFTPEETGTFQYSCSMGMYVGTITVVDDINNYDKAAVQKEVDSAAASGGGGGCCGG